MVEIRKGTLADEEAIADLIKVLGSELGITREVDPVSWYSTLRQMLASPEWTFIIAEDGDEKVGLLVLLTLPSLYLGGSYGAITELIVPERFQGRGIGKLLVDEARRISRNLGCEELRVSVEVQNENAIGFYNKLGFERDHDGYCMKL